MSPIEQALVSQLKAWSNLTALVGDRIRPGQLAVGEPLPAITWMVESYDTRLYSQGSGPATMELLLSCWGRNQAEARAVVDALTIPPADDAEAMRLDDFQAAYMGTDNQRQWVLDTTTSEDPEQINAPEHGRTKGTHCLNLRVKLLYDR